MTYSFYLRRWAMERMNENLLGRDAIALVCNVAPRTISSWARAESGLGPYLLSTPRESDRALAILLYEKFPSHLDQVAKICRTTPRAIIEWRMQVRSARYQSELIWATRLALTTLHYRIDEFFEVRNNVITLRKGYFPDTELLEEMIFCVYDNILMHILSHTFDHYVRGKVAALDHVAISLGMAPLVRLERSLTPVLRRPLGPHRYRGSRLHDNGYVDFDKTVQMQRESLYHEAPSVAWLYHTYRNRMMCETKLEDMLEILSSPEVRRIKYKMKYAGRTVSWNEAHALHAYLSKVHPELRCGSYPKKLA
jgi:hypothetical protein